MCICAKLNNKRGMAMKRQLALTAQMLFQVPFFVVFVIANLFTLSTPIKLGVQATIA